jgi:hypothetical protein
MSTKGTNAMSPGRSLHRFSVLAAGIIISNLSAFALADQVGATLDPNKSLQGSRSDFIAAISGAAHFVMQGDCNLVLYHGDRAVWASNTDGKGNNCHADMQGDGNLVVYGGGHEVIWASNTDGNPGAYLIAQNDGNVVIYRQGHQDSGNALWATDTVIPAPQRSRQGSGSNPHPGCRFSRTDTKCYGVGFFCKAVWSCGFDRNLNEVTQDDGWKFCGGCIGFHSRNNLRDRVDKFQLGDTQWMNKT